MNRRITKPPGGETNEIFNSPSSTPPSTPRKVKNYMASNIFTPDVEAQQRAVRHRPDNDSFKRLFGGEGKDSTDSPRMKNHQKSNIIFSDDAANGKANGHTNGTNGHSNGHSNGHGNGYENGSGHSTPNGNGSLSSGGSTNGSINGDAPVKMNGTNGHTNGVNGTNGHTNGVNGTNGHGANGHGTNGVHDNGTNGTNGTHYTNGTNGTNGMSPARRIPPGGFSSKLW